MKDADDPSWRLQLVRRLALPTFSVEDLRKRLTVLSNDHELVRGVVRK